jgi:hypothetical protein
MNTVRPVTPVRAIAALGLVAAFLVGCGTPPVAETIHEDPAAVTEIEGTDLSEIVLTARAAERLGIRTAAVEGAPGAGGRLVIPYSAVLYDAAGKTWAYVSPRLLTYHRAPIDVESIAGDHAILTRGPERGVAVVSVGATELFGAEFQVGH